MLVIKPINLRRNQATNVLRMPIAMASREIGMTRGVVVKSPSSSRRAFRRGSAGRLAMMHLLRPGAAPQLDAGGFGPGRFYIASRYISRGRLRPRQLALIWNGMGVAEARVSRTHRRPSRTTSGFEDREDHRSLSTSTLRLIQFYLRKMIHRGEGGRA